MDNRNGSNQVILVALLCITMISFVFFTVTLQHSGNRVPPVTLYATATVAPSYTVAEMEQIVFKCGLAYPNGYFVSSPEWQREWLEGAVQEAPLPCD